MQSAKYRFWFGESPWAPDYFVLEFVPHEVQARMPETENEYATVMITNEAIKRAMYGDKAKD